MIIAKCYDKRNRLLSVGTNSYDKTHPYQKHCAVQADLISKVYLHAEIDAIIKLRGRSCFRIHIERYDKKGNPMLAAPCPICQIAIKKAGIKQISYTTGA